MHGKQQQPTRARIVIMMDGQILMPRSNSQFRKSHKLRPYVQVRLLPICPQSFCDQKKKIGQAMRMITISITVTMTTPFRMYSVTTVD